MITNSDIYSAITDIIGANIGGLYCYAGDVVDSFQTPAAFIKIMSSQQRANKNTVRITSTAYIDIATDEIGQQDQFDLQAAIYNLFRDGLKIKDRYLHTQQIEILTDNDNKDIMQIAIHFKYYDLNGHLDSMNDAPPIQKVTLKQRIKFD